MVTGFPLSGNGWESRRRKWRSGWAFPYRRAEQGKPDISVAGLAGIMEAAGLGRFLEREDANASLQYWIRTMNAVKGYMLSHYCSAETAMKEMCIPPEDRELLLHLIREDVE